MGFSRHFYPEHDFVYTQRSGGVDDNRLRIHLLSSATDAKGMKKIKQLADARGIEKADSITVRGTIELSDLDRKQSAGTEETLAIPATQPLPIIFAALF